MLHPKNVFGGGWHAIPLALLVALQRKGILAIGSVGQFAEAYMAYVGYGRNKVAFL